MSMPDEQPRFSNEDIEAAIARIQQDTQEQIRAALADQEKRHQAEMQALRDSMNGVTASPVPAHSGGPGTRIMETWSLYDQQLAARGEHPLQLEEEKAA